MIECFADHKMAAGVALEVNEVLKVFEDKSKAVKLINKAKGGDIFLIDTDGGKNSKLLNKCVLC